MTTHTPAPPSDAWIEWIRVRAEKDSQRFGRTVDIPVRADLLLGLLSKLRAPLADERAANDYTPTHDQPHHTGVGEWCAPGPAAGQRRAWLLRFADADRGDCVYYDEQEARRAFAQAEGRGWNCYLFEYARRAALASAPVDPEAAEVDFLVQVIEKLETWSAEEWNELIERRPAILAMLRPLVMASAPVAGEATDADPTPKDQYRRMFTAACAALGAVTEKLGLDPDDAEPDVMLTAIDELIERAANAAPQASEAVRTCTCHPDDRPAGECQKKYAAQECQTQADKDGGDCAKGAGDAEDAARYRLAASDCILILRGDAALGRAEWDRKLDRLATQKGAK